MGDLVRDMKLKPVVECWSDKQSLFAVADARGYVCILDTNSRTCVRLFKKEATGIAFIDDEFLITFKKNNEASSFEIFDVKIGKCVQALTDFKNISALCTTKEYVILSFKNDEIKCFKIKNSKYVQSLHKNSQNFFPEQSVRGLPD